jgi:hypothetical protein
LLTSPGGASSFDRATHRSIFDVLFGQGSDSDARGNCVVSIDGTGVFRADQIVRAIAASDRRVSSASIDAQMADE